MTATSTLAPALALLAAAALAAMGTPTARRVALARGWLDRPGGHKAHATPVPVLGGVAVAGAVVAVTAVAAGMLTEVDAETVLGVLGVAVVVGSVGLADDLREVPVAVRVTVEVAAAIALWALGVRAQLAFVAWIDLSVTVLWVVGITNAFNLLDNMDGLSSGIAAIAAVGFATIAAINGQVEVAVLAAAAAGGAAGFLRHNRHPARIYLGDAGALFLGVVVAAVGMALTFDAPRSVTFAVPILVLGVPLLDTALVVVSRLRSGRSPFAGGRDHISHRLTAVGIPVPAAVGLIHGAGIGCTWLAVVLSRVDEVTGYLLIGFVVAVGTFLFGLLGRVPVASGDTPSVRVEFTRR